MKDKHVDVHKKFNAILPDDLRQEWAKMISQWEQDKTQANPYTHTEKGIYRLPFYYPHLITFTFH